MVGSDDQSDLHLPSATISKDHASVVFENNEFILRDNGSLSGSFLNGEPISRATLKHQDLIRFGEYLFMVDLNNEEEDDIFNKPLETASPSEVNNPQANVNVTVSQGTDGFSKVMNITQPDVSKRQTQNLRDKRTSQNIRLLLSEPIPYNPQPRPRKAGTAAIKIDNSRLISARTNFFINILGMPIIYFLGIFMTLFFLPIQARAPLVKAPGFQALPLSRFVSSLILREGASQKEVVALTPGSSYTSKISLPRDVLVVGKMQLGIKPVKSHKLHIVIKTIDKTPVVVLDEMTELKPGADQVELFSKILPGGSYDFECTWEENGQSLNENPQDEISMTRQIPGVIFLTSKI
jgi:pSer/pThr/pTyr-binding forkhead associated (FHA) protein